ncbi:MAG: hypothetical protein M3Q64_02930 [bacterium]|nr:hypothetical protein [bacterium]
MGYVIPEAMSREATKAIRDPFLDSGVRWNDILKLDLKLWKIVYFVTL